MNAPLSGKLLFAALLFNTALFAQKVNSTNTNIMMKGTEFAAVRETIAAYCDYYTGIRYVISGMNEHVDDQKFRQLFDSRFDDPDAEGIIPPDFPDTSGLKIVDYERGNKKMNLREYVNDLAANLEILDSCITQSTDEIYYCDHNSYWYVWIRKNTTYWIRDKEIKFSGIVKLTLTRSKDVSAKSGLFKITNIDLADRLPTDMDHDFIADEEGCDVCITSLAGNRVNILTSGGCPDTYLDGKKPASSRFALTLSGGLVATLNNEFSSKDVQGGNATIKSGYFNKAGIMVDVNGIFTLNRWLGFKLGILFTHNGVNTKELEAKVNSFMEDNGYTIPVRFNDVSRQLLIPHMDIRLGDFNKTQGVLSVDATLGLALTNLPLLNKDLTYYTDFDGGNQLPNNEFSRISFKSDPFVVYGGRLNYEYSLSRDGAGRFIFSLYYLTGNYAFSNQSIVAPTTGNTLQFQGSRLQIWGISLGFFFNLLKPKVWTEMEKLKSGTTTDPKLYF